MPNLINIDECLKSGKIDKTECFALDTNVLIWTFYSRATSKASYQRKVYPNFIQHLITCGNKIFITAVNLNEMFHFIENNELDIYNNDQGFDDINKINKKKFRSIAIERCKVKSEISLIFKQLEAINNICIVGTTLEVDKLTNFLNDYEVHKCDFFDYYLINYCNQNNISIITDDIDFDNKFNLVNLYSANKKLLGLQSN